jgi:GT2 family glycosyltransferase
MAGGRQFELRRDTWAERWKAIHLRQDKGDAPLVDPDYLSGGNLVIDCRRVAKLRFDERYTVAYEDVDFCRRARAAGLHLVYEPSAIVHHDHRETLWTLPSKVWSYGSSSRSLGIRTRTDVVRAFVRMHLRPHDQVRVALRADWRHARLRFLLIDLYLLLASLSLFVASAIAPSRLRGTPAALRE